MLAKRAFVDLFTLHENSAQKSVCYSKFCGGGMTIIEINPDGRINLCGRYSENYPEVYVQDVNTPDFLGLNQIKKFTWFTNIRHSLIKGLGCDTCYADYVCDHGCMAFHYSKYGKYGIRDNLVCNIFKPLYRFFAENKIELAEAFFKEYGNYGTNENGYHTINTGEKIFNIRVGAVDQLIREKGIEIKFNPQKSEYSLELKRVNQ